MPFEEYLAEATAALQQGRWKRPASRSKLRSHSRRPPERSKAWLRSTGGYAMRAQACATGNGPGCYSVSAAMSCDAGRAAIDLSISYLVNLGNDVAARGWLGPSRTPHPPPRSGPAPGMAAVDGGRHVRRPRAGRRSQLARPWPPTHRRRGCGSGRRGTADADTAAALLRALGVTGRSAPRNGPGSRSASMTCCASSDLVCPIPRSLPAFASAAGPPLAM